MRARLKFIAPGVEPFFRSVIFFFHHIRARAPVVFLARDETAALPHQNPLAAGSQLMQQRAAAGPRANNNDVIMIVHDAKPPFAPQKMQRLGLSWCSLQHLTANLPFHHRYSSAAQSMPSGGATK